MQKRTKALIAGGCGVAVVGGGVLAVVLLTGPGSASAALGVLPEDTTTIEFVDRDAWAERTGLDDIGHDFSDRDLDRFRSKARDSLVATPLAQYLQVMEEAPFNEFDVDWYVSGTRGESEDDGDYWEVYRLDDEIDLDDVTDDLADSGYEKSSVGGHDRFTGGPDLADVNGTMADHYPGTFLDVTVIEDEHLLVVSRDPGPVVDVVDGDADSLADSDTVPDLFAEADRPEFAHVALGDRACRLGRAATTTDPDALEQPMKDTGADQLGTPEASAYFLVPDGDDVVSQSVLLFSSGDAAVSDAKAREKWLRDGTDPRTLEPLSDFVDVDSVEADGSAVITEATFRDERLGAQMAFESGGIVACNPIPGAPTP
ncbi:hypothetical protein [Nocardioides jensenii]|uniref:hypothetical protein n=1 Tax=Nocardioides jensenii TaxID=1843 RepID=UPI0008370FBF|nr:hypothetical protein [Nocardioides jensenii]